MGGLLLEFGLVLRFQLREHVLVLLGDFGDQHAIVRATAVLQQYGKDLPDIRDQRELFVCMLQALLYQFVEAHRVDKQCTVDSVDELVRNPGQSESYPVDAVATDRVLVLWLQHNPRDVEVLGVGKRFINPCFQHFRRHLNLFVHRAEPSTLGREQISSVRSRMHHCPVGFLAAAATLLGQVVAHAPVMTVCCFHLLSKLLLDYRDVQKVTEWVLLLLAESDRWQLQVVEIEHQAPCCTKESSFMSSELTEGRLVVFV